MPGPGEHEEEEEEDGKGNDSLLQKSGHALGSGRLDAFGIGCTRQIRNGRAVYACVKRRQPSHFELAK